MSCFDFLVVDFYFFGIFYRCLSVLGGISFLYMFRYMVVLAPLFRLQVTLLPCTSTSLILFPRQIVYFFSLYSAARLCKSTKIKFLYFWTPASLR